jgi:hypothetical protein
MSESISQNDDDLFNYDPSKEKTSAHNISSFSDTSNSKVSNEVYEQIAKSIDQNDDENFLKLNGLRMKFSQAILNSYDFWLSPVYTVSYFATTVTVLDQLTDGKFSDLFLYNYLENSIVRRSHIIFLLTETFDSKNIKDSESFDRFLEKMEIKLTDAYVPTYVGTLVRISSHILSKQRAMYISLANKLNIVPNSVIFDAHPSIEEVFKATQFDNIAGVQEAVIARSFNSNFSGSFVEKLNNLNATNIDYQIRNL